MLNIQTEMIWMFGVSTDVLRKHFVALKDPAYEPAFDHYVDYLAGLNDICLKSKDLLEGNLFYSGPQDFSDNLAQPPEPRYLNKRRDYATYVLSGSSLLEIGFNAGHSALLALSVNPGLRYFGIDYGNHPYTKPCFEYLRKIFGDRIELWIGDSRDLVPALRHSHNYKFNLFHIDGGHDFGVAYADMCNVTDLSMDGDVILFDDTNSGVSVWLLDEICDYFVMRGMVTRLECPKLWQSDQHVLLRVNKRLKQS
jgi:hypothetical protein